MTAFGRKATLFECQSYPNECLLETQSAHSDMMHVDVNELCKNIRMQQVN